MRAPGVWLVGIACVPLSSALGLWRPMRLGGGDVFIDVWRADIWGDVVFTVGTALGCAGALFLLDWARRFPTSARIAITFLTAPALLLATWFTYAAAWTLTGPAFNSDGTTFEDVAFQASLSHVWFYGKAGILTLAGLPACLGLWLWAAPALAVRRSRQVRPLP